MKIIIATGGTGGHIYPAISLAEAIKDLNEKAEILFIGTSDHMEATMVPNAGFSFKSIIASGLKGNMFMQVAAAFKLYTAVSECTMIIKEFKPDIVVGFGGYVSVPVIIAASKLKIPTMLHEQNAYAGRANLFLEKYATAVVVSYEEAYRQFSKKPVFLLGNPRVYQVKKQASTNVLAEYGLDKNKPIVMFVMGSQGSTSVNNIMINVLQNLRNKPYRVLYVTGNSYYESFIERFKSNDNIIVIPYVKQTEMLEHVSLIVTRGGATTATEICAFNVPSIIIPSPYVPNNHQEINAQALVNRKAAFMIRESELTSDKLIEQIDKIMEEPFLLNQMRQNTKALCFINAAEDMIKLMEKVVNKVDLK